MSTFQFDPNSGGDAWGGRVGRRLRYFSAISIEGGSTIKRAEDPTSSCSYRIRGRVSLRGITEGRWIMVLKGCNVCRYTLRRAVSMLPISERRGGGGRDIGSRRRQTGTLLLFFIPFSREYPRKCNLPSIQPLISKELLEPVSICIYIFLCAMDALSEARRGGEADVAARVARDSRIRRRLEKSTLARSDPRLPNLPGYIYIFERDRRGKESKRMDSPRPGGRGIYSSV